MGLVGFRIGDIAMLRDGHVPSGWLGGYVINVADGGRGRLTITCSAVRHAERIRRSQTDLSAPRSR